MTNAELFKKVFGIYAGEFWAFNAEKMQAWLASDAQIADVKESVHARWVKVGQSFLNPHKFRCYACSKCGFSVDYIPFRFCPNCGADMRGEQN